MDEKKSAAYLREKRIALDLTLSELAEKVGVGAYDVSCWEAGFFPEAKYLLPLSRALGVSVEEILKGEDEPPETFSAPRASGELPESHPCGARRFYADLSRTCGAVRSCAAGFSPTR